MGLGFLGGLGTALGAAQQGYEHSEDREQLKADREYQRRQREYQAGQQQRTLDEQKRDDEFRIGMQGISPTESVNQTTTIPEQKTVYGNSVRVARDQDGNLMPGAEETPAQTTTQQVTRQRNKDDVLMDYANMARKSGKIDLAMKFEDQAEKASHTRSAELFRQWDSSASPDADLLSSVRTAQQIYNGDRLPGKIVDYAPNPNGSGGVILKMANAITGQTVDLPIQNVADLKQRMEAYFSPDTYNAYVKSKREAAIKSQEKIAEERAKGHVVQAGATFVPGEGDPRKPYANEIGYIEDEKGNLIKGSAKGATGKQPLTGADSAFKHFDDTFKNKTDDGWTQEQLVQARNLSGQIAQDSGLQGPAAVDIATRVIKNPALLQYGIDPATGQMAKVYKDANYPQAIPVYKGVSTAGMKPDDYKSAATAFLAAQ
ncbi:MAG: hypothetical protein ACKO0Z_10555, partial [Betaproteobacteria bacterium]